MVGTIAPYRVEAPPVSARRFGLLSVATVRPAGARSGFAAEWESVACGDVRSRVMDCSLDPPATPSPKVVETDNGFIRSLDPFAVYAIYECSLFDRDLSVQRARETLDLGATRGVELGLGTWLTANANAVGTTFASASLGVGAVEQAAGVRYMGQPVIHSDLQVAVRAIAERAAYVDGDRLFSALGSPWVASPMYAANTIFASGTVLVLEGETITAEGLDVTKNQHRALAERVYTVGSECACPDDTNCIPVKVTLT